MRGFAAAFGVRGHPGISPGRLIMASVLRFSENLTDRQAAEAGTGASVLLLSMFKWLNQLRERVGPGSLTVCLARGRSSPSASSTCDGGGVAPEMAVAKAAS
jgi:hypothetical protein